MLSRRGQPSAADRPTGWPLSGLHERQAGMAGRARGPCRICTRNTRSGNHSNLTGAAAAAAGDRPIHWPGGQEIDRFQTSAPVPDARFRRGAGGAAAARGRLPPRPGAAARPPSRPRRRWCPPSAPSRAPSTATPAATRSPRLFTHLTQARLVRIDRRTQELEPWLAESWTASPDGLTYTLTLRRGVDLLGRHAVHVRRRPLLLPGGLRREDGQLPRATRCGSAASRWRSRRPTRPRWSSRSRRRSAPASGCSTTCRSCRGTSSKRRWPRAR